MLWQHVATTPNWYSEINVIFYSLTLARTLWFPDDGPRTETFRSVFNVLMCTFYICAVVGVVTVQPVFNKAGNTHINEQCGACA